MSETKTLPAFNDGRPLKVVRLEDGRFGVVDEAHFKVWIEKDLASTWLPNVKTLPAVEVPEIPGSYGKWDKKSIGGVSWTVRRVGLLRGANKYKDPIVLFATRSPQSETVRLALRHLSDHCCVGDTEQDEEFGYLNEVIVYRSKDMDHIAALLSRLGCEVLLEDESANAQRCIGIERLDRIPSRAMDSHMDDEDIYGLRRGSDNWSFPWLPQTWRHVPVTWDPMVENLIETTTPQEIELIPQPLRQHVALKWLRRGDHDPLGSRWKTTLPPGESEQMNTAASNPISRIVWSDPPEALHKAPLERHELSGVTLRTIFQAEDGLWYRPIDTRRFLEKHVPPKRYVSAALSTAQSKQLVTAFYLLTVEKVSDETLQQCLSLILFHYFKERGYTARWLGKYVQDGRHIGNGDRFRKFNRLTQYAPESIPSDVLAKLCGKDGRLVNRGSKGSRSKHKPREERYIPKRRLKRTRDDEERMVQGITPSDEWEEVAVLQHLE